MSRAAPHATTPPTPPGDDAAGPRISVVVTSYTLSREPDLDRLLESLRRQTYPNVEIVFVGEGDRELCDRVARRAEVLGLSEPLLAFNEGPRGASAARNLGVGLASGDVVAFIDDDAQAQPDWAEEMARTYTDHPDIAGVAGAVEPIWRDPATRWFPEELYWIIGCTGWLDGGETLSPAQSGATVNVSYRKQALRAAGGFSAGLGPARTGGARRSPWAEGIAEDTDLLLRVRKATGAEVLYNPKMRVGHSVEPWRTGLRWVVRRSAGVGWSRRMLERTYGQQSRGTVGTQQGLLWRIAVDLMPRIARSFGREPGKAWRQLRVTVAAVVAVGVGYLSFGLAGRPDARS